MTQQTTEAEQRKAWFLAQVGKRVYRNKPWCGCHPCMKSFSIGIKVLDADGAMHLYNMECEDGTLKYSSDKSIQQIEFIIKIIACSGERLWYKNNLHDKVKVHHYNEEHYIVKESTTVRLIKKCDAIVLLNDTESTDLKTFE